MSARRVWVFALLIGCCVLVFSVVNRWPGEGTILVFTELNEAQTGRYYVIGEYRGFGSGWNMAFVHETPHEAPVAYYVAHEVVGLDHPRIRLENDLVVLHRSDGRLATYHPDNGTFTHHRQGITREVEDGRRYAREVANWGRSDAGDNDAP